MTVTHEIIACHAWRRHLVRSKAVEGDLTVIAQLWYDPIDIGQFDIFYPWNRCDMNAMVMLRRYLKGAA